MEFENTIGLETHVQLKTNTKMFCSCLLKTGCEPNTNVCPVCLGYPGALPVMNKEAVKLTVKSGMMLGCEINRHATFDRKNYFYPDMAKDYQISENGNPLCIGGGVEITRADGTKKFIRINHIHLEEDAAKINHYATTSGVDFNRGGTPLMEIVSEPDMESADDAILYLTALKEILVYTGVSECNLEEGNMRSDVNISIRPKGENPGVLPTKADGSIDFSKLGTKVEIKNMNSFSGIHAALTYEAKRQRECMAHSIPLVQETRRWDPDAMETAPMRSKENAHDYRYFPEPDLVPVELSEEWIAAWRAELPEKPEARRARMVEEYGIAEYDAEILSQHKANADYFEAAAKGEDERALMGEFKVVDWMDGKATGATKSKGLTTFIDNDILEEIPSKLEEKVATLKCMLLRADLIRANALLVSLATNANKTWSSGTPTPDMDVKAAINAARAALGQQPNRILFGGGAWEARDTALAKQNTAGAFAGLMRLESDVARFYRVRDLKINDLVYDLPGTGKTPIIADAKVFVFTGNTMPSTADASNVKRFWSPVVGGGEWAVFVDRTHSAELTKDTVYHRSAILSPNAVGVQSLTIS